VIFNSRACDRCHNNITLDWIRKKQKTFKEKLTLLASFLPKDEKNNPLLPKDPSLTPFQSEIAFNYFQIVRDGSFGIQNPTYKKQLLLDSLDAIKKSGVSLNH